MKRGHQNQDDDHSLQGMNSCKNVIHCRPDNTHKRRQLWRHYTAANLILYTSWVGEELFLEAEILKAQMMSLRQIGYEHLRGIHKNWTRVLTLGCRLSYASRLRTTLSFGWLTVKIWLRHRTATSTPECRCTLHQTTSAAPESPWPNCIPLAND